MSALALARLDLLRLAGSKRWIGVAVAWLAIAVLATAQLEVRSQTLGLAANAWDVRLVAVNNWMYVGYMQLLAFAFLVGDSVSADRATGWSAACVTRARGVRVWWAAKVVFVIASAFVYHVCFLVFTLLFAVANGLSLTPAGSALARAPLSPGALFAPLAGGEVLLMRVAVSLLHETLGFSAICLLGVALCVRSKRSATTTAFVMIGAIIDWVMAQRVTLWELASPGRRLLESVHLQVNDAVGTSWTSTFVYLGVVLLAAVLIGRAGTRVLDI